MLYIFVSFLMAVASLIKFTAIFISVSMLMFMTVFFLYKKQIKHLCCMLLVYIISILVLLVISGQKITNLPAYLLNSYEVSEGYSYAMILNGPLREVCIGFCVVGLMLFLLLTSILKNKPNSAYFILISLGFVFVSFKHGFIRHDGHVYIFFGNALLIFCSMYITNKKQFPLLSRWLSLIMTCVLIAFIFKQHPRLIIPDVPGNLKMISSALSLATDNAAGKTQKLENIKSEMRKAYSLNDETIKYIGNKSMDIMPWEISLPFAYNLKWSPCPVFQSYNAYTDKLDMLNSRYFESVNAPEFLLYDASRFVDDRYPLFDTPATFRTILRNYKPAFTDGQFIILQKADTRNRPPSKIISVIDTELGKHVSIPKTKQPRTWTSSSNGDRVGGLGHHVSNL